MTEDEQTAGFNVAIKDVEGLVGQLPFMFQGTARQHLQSEAGRQIIWDAVADVITAAEAARAGQPAPAPKLNAVHLASTLAAEVECEWVVVKHTRLPIATDEVVGKYPDLEAAVSAYGDLVRHTQWFTTYGIEKRIKE